METNLVLEQPVYKTSTFHFLWNVFRNPLHALTDLAQEQGDIARVKLRKRELFLLSHPAFIEEVLVDLPPKNRSKTNDRIGSIWRQKQWQKERNTHQNRSS